MKNDEFRQLTLWSEEVLAELEISPSVGEISEIDQESNKQKGEEVSYTQLTLDGLWA